MAVAVSPDPSGPAGETPLLVGDLDPGATMHVTMPARATMKYPGSTDGWLAVRVGTERAPVRKVSGSTWTGTANQVSLLAPSSADQLGSPVSLPGYVKSCSVPPT